VSEVDPRKSGWWTSCAVGGHGMHARGTARDVHELLFVPSSVRTMHVMDRAPKAEMFTGVASCAHTDHLAHLRAYATVQVEWLRGRVHQGRLHILDTRAVCRFAAAGPALRAIKPTLWFLPAVIKSTVPIGTSKYFLQSPLVCNLHHAHTTHCTVGTIDQSVQLRKPK
jgi:hypothetical protein